MITVENLTYNYPGSSNPAVKNISFTINEGEIFGFLGPSGAGKSTTQKILIGLLKDYSGIVEVEAQNIKEINDDYYEEIGVSFEIANHYLKLTGLENLQYFASFYQQANPDLHSLLRQVGLADDANTKVSEYSKGMKNRLCFIRSMIHDPKILFLDEPTAGLDPVNARKIQDIIKQEQKKGKTIFLTTHDMQVAETLCDRVAFIVDGEIKAIDKPDNLKQQYGKQTVRVVFGNGNSQPMEFPLNNLGFNEEFLQAIQREAIQKIHSQEASLNDVFIEVTGRELS